MNKFENTPAGGYQAFSWDMEFPERDLELTYTRQQEERPQNEASGAEHSHTPFSIDFESEEYSPIAEHEEQSPNPSQPDEEVSEDPSQTSSIDTEPPSDDIQSIRERAESYEKYKSLFRRVVGKVAHSKGFRKVARIVATFSLMFALASCDAGVAEQPHDSAVVDFIDDIEHNSGADSSQVDLDNIPTTEGQVDLDNLPQEQDSQTGTQESGPSHETQETKGIFDGYNKKGMWTSQNKGGAYDFASAVEVAEVCNDDECDMVKYAAANQVECFADYLANLPEALQPEGFKGLTILEAEHRLESLSVDEFEAIKKQFNETIDTAFTRDVTLDGYYHNAYMRLRDPSKPATHDNMELVECITYEEGTQAVELYFTDDGTANGNVIGGITVKISREGGNITGGCLQAVTTIEEGARVYSDLTTVAENPTPENEPDSNPEPIPDSNPTPNPNPEPEPEPDDVPDEHIEAKDPYNLTRIDDNIEQTIENNIGSSDVQNHNDLDKGDLTEQPDSQDYEGTEAETVTNDASSSAEFVQDDISDDNTYTLDLGGANADEYAPVQADQTADDAALQSEIPVSDTYVMGEDISDILSDLGIQKGI